MKKTTKRKEKERKRIKEERVIENELKEKRKWKKEHKKYFQVVPSLGLFLTTFYGPYLFQHYTSSHNKKCNKIHNKSWCIANIVKL